jgi:hypothetical protein
VSGSRACSRRQHRRYPGWKNKFSYNLSQCKPSTKIIVLIHSQHQFAPPTDHRNVHSHGPTDLPAILLINADQITSPPRPAHLHRPSLSRDPPAHLPTAVPSDVLTDYQIFPPIPPHHLPCLATATAQVCRSALLYAELNLFLPVQLLFPTSRYQAATRSTEAEKNPCQMSPLPPGSYVGSPHFFPATRKLHAQYASQHQRNYSARYAFLPSSVNSPWLSFSQVPGLLPDRQVHRRFLFSSLDSKKASRARWEPRGDRCASTNLARSRTGKQTCGAWVSRVCGASN